MAKNAMVIYRGSWSKCYFATRQYKHLPTGGIQAYAKEDVTAQVEALVAERITEVFDRLITAAEGLDVSAFFETPNGDGVYDDGTADIEVIDNLVDWLRDRQREAMADGE